jgi:hypothetical protein
MRLSKSDDNQRRDWSKGNILCFKLKLEYNLALIQRQNFKLCSLI